MRVPDDVVRSLVAKAELLIADGQKPEDWNAGLTQAEAALLGLDLLDARARCRKMKEALKLLLAYTEQVELLAYDHGERAIKHPVVQQANRALRGEEAGE